MRFVLPIVTGFALATAAAATEPTPKPKAPKLTGELVAKGRAAYETACASCHGTAGDGNGPAGMYLNPKPRQFGKEPFKQGDSVEQIFMTLQTGVAGTPMVAFAHLPEDDRWAISYYVSHFLSTKGGKQVKKLVDKLPPLGAPPATPAPAPAATPAPAAEAPATTP
jgi:mono/diheme cytochrome c family protein